MKNNTQNEKIARITDETMVVGIDIGSEMHYARAFTNRGIEFSSKPFAFPNNEEGFAAFQTWAEDLMAKNGMTRIIVGMEPTGHYWFNLGAFLMDCGVEIVHVNPYHVKQSKELDDNSPSKNDRKDPKVIAGLVNGGRYLFPYMPKEDFAEIRNLSYMRDQVREQMIRLKNRFARWISLYFPEYKGVYSTPDAISGLMALRAAPLPEDIVKLGVDGIIRIWREAKLKGLGRRRAEALVKAAEHSIGYKEGLGAARMEISYLLEDIERCKARLAELAPLLEQAISKIPNTDKLLGIKGIGNRTVQGFLAEVGDIGRFDNPKQLQKLAGLAIVESESGKQKGEHHISYRGRKKLRYDLFQGALCVVSKNAEFKEIYEYYRTRKENPLKKMQALIAVACKLIRVFYVILTKGVAYDGTKMLNDIHRRQETEKAA